MSQTVSSIDMYIQELKNECIGGEGLPEIIKEVPNIFKTLHNLLKDKDLENKQRMMVFAAVGYFFIPDDLFPEEELGQVGYIDDIILGLTIFQDICSTTLGKNAVIRNWTLNLNLDIVLDEILLKLSKDYHKQYIAVLDHVGLIPDDVDLNYE